MVLTEGSYACMMDEAGRLPVFIFPSEAEFVIGPSSSGDPNRNRKIFGLYNPFDYPITYKVLATAPDNYEVEENAGTIRSKAKKDIIVRCRRRLEAGTVEKLRFETRKLGEKELLGQRDIALRTVWVASRASSESPSDPRTSDRTSREQRPREPVVRVEPQAQEPGAELEKYQRHCVVIAFLCAVALFLPTIGDANAGVSFLPHYFHLTLQQKLVAAYLLGVTTILILKPQLGNR